MSWKRESNRHSLASRGIATVKTHFKQIKEKHPFMTNLERKAHEYFIDSNIVPISSDIMDYIAYNLFEDDYYPTYDVAYKATEKYMKEKYGDEEGFELISMRK